jgi:type II secretory pathway pseudopilin PulG
VGFFSAHKNAITAWRSGLTLVELLIVLAISILVLGAAVSLYQVNARVYVQQDALLEQNQNLRVGMYTVARDARMAGNSFPLLGPNITRIQVAGVDGEWFQYPGSTEYGVRPVWGEDGGASGTDTLTIFRSEAEAGSPVGQLAVDVPLDGSATSLVLFENYKYKSLEPGDVIALVNGDQAALLSISTNPGHFPTATVNPSDPDDVVVSGERNDIQLGGNPRFRPTEAHHDITAFPVGTFVYNLRDITFVTYSIDDNHNLVADYHDAGVAEYDSDADKTVIVATNIEDFQVGYLYGRWAEDGGGDFIVPMSGAPGLDEGQLDAGAWVVAMSLGMVGRSSTDDGSSKNRPPELLLNHATTGPGDGFQRRVLTETVYLRNFPSEGVVP